ncbi:MAG: two-component regulator propeller domain-containing protein [Flavobacteriales bacterium]
MRYLKVLLLLFCLSFVKAQEYSFIPYNVEDGLSQTQISSICQDDDGYIWFGTAGGASRFDGKNFKNYSKNDGLLDNLIIKIQKDSIGQIWLASDYGINSIKKNKVKAYRIDEVNKSNQITDFMIAGNNTFYLAIRNKGLYLLTIEDKKTTLKKIDTKGLSSNIRSIFKDKEGKLWIGTNNEVAYLKNNEIILVDIPQSRQLNVSKIIQDKKGDIWIATVEEGVYKYDGTTFHNYNTNNGLISYSIRDVLEDHHGNIWFTSKIGVSKLGKKGFQEFTPENGLEFDNVKVVTEDAEGNIWFGTDGSGVLKFTGDAFVNFTTRQDLSSNYVMSITQDQENNYWFGTYGGGICRYDGLNMTVFDRSNSLLANNTVWAGICDRGGNLWFGTSGGVTRYDGKQFKSYTTNDGLLTNKVTAIFEDTRNRIWFGTPSGLSVWSESAGFSNYEDENGFEGLHVRAFCQDQEGVVWMGCSNGLFYYSKGSFEKLWDTLLTENTIYSLQVDFRNNLWIGTANGIFFYDRLKIKKIKTIEAFSANYINFLKFENQNTLWVGTNYGVLELQLPNFYKTGKVEFVHYTRSNGIPSLETNLNAVYKDKSGDMWFGTGGGLTRFSRFTVDESQQDFMPFLSLNDVKLFLEIPDWEKKGKEIDPYTGIPVNLKLKYNQNHLSFVYTGISHSNPSKVRFRYKLIGLDEDWSPVLYTNIASYPNLPHGNFVFMVQSSVDGERWTNPVSFPFSISPPFWLTWWFYTLIILSVLGAIYLYVGRVKKTEQQKRENELIKLQSKLLTLEQQSLNASMNRHFIFNSLNSIQYYINTQDKLAANRYLTNFAKLIRKNLDSSSSGESLVSLSEELERLELYLSLENMRFQNKFTYEINIGTEIDAEALKVPGMFLQPYIENSIWHGILPMEEEGHIKLEIKKTSKNTILFLIEDNGIGIDTSLRRKKAGQKHQSRGVEINRSRIELLQEITKSDILLKGPYQYFDENHNPAGTRVEIEVSI